MQDLYSENDRFGYQQDRNEALKAYNKLEPWGRLFWPVRWRRTRCFIFYDFENVGGVPSPIPLDIHYEDGSSRALMIPAEMSASGCLQGDPSIDRAKPIAYVQIDRGHQTADTDYANSRFPPEIRSSRLKTYKREDKNRNLIADLLVELEEIG